MKARFTDKAMLLKDFIATFIKTKMGSILFCMQFFIQMPINCAYRLGAPKPVLLVIVALWSAVWFLLLLVTLELMVFIPCLFLFLGAISR
jgi:hypothetical protein